MEISPKSCVCQSTNKIFWIVAYEKVRNLTSLCGNESELAINFNTQDYEALGFCQPPVMDRYYSVGLRLPSVNSKSRGKCNNSHRYFWSARKTEDNEIDCVDGSPLELPRNFDEDERCNLASVLPGSLNQIYNANWTRCNSTQYSICQLEKDTFNSSDCISVSTPSATIITETATTATTITTATTALSNNNTAIIIGSVLGVFAVLFLLWLLHFFRKRNNAKRNASDNEKHEEVYNK